MAVQMQCTCSAHAGRCSSADAVHMQCALQMHSQKVNGNLYCCSADAGRFNYVNEVGVHLQCALHPHCICTPMAGRTARGGLLQCTCSADAGRLQRRCSAFAAQMQCICSAYAVQMQCKCFIQKVDFVLYWILVCTLANSVVSNRKTYTIFQYLIMHKVSPQHLVYP